MAALQAYTSRSMLDAMHMSVDAMLATAAAAAIIPSRAIDEFCDAASFEGDFSNWLGGLTPCFADVAVLGAYQAL